MTALSIEHDALLILSYILNSALHHLPDEPGVEEAAKPARNVVGEAQALLACNADAGSRSRAVGILADGFAPLAALGFDPRTLYTFATVGRVAATTETPVLGVPDLAAIKACMRTRRGPTIGDALRVAGALHEKWWNERAAVSGAKKPPSTLNDRQMQIAVCLWLDALIAEIEKLPQDSYARNMFAACQDLREQLVFWDANAVLREIVHHLQMYPEGKTVHDRVSEVTRMGHA